MAWLWKQRRPTLLAVVGIGVLGYKMLHQGDKPVDRGRTDVGMWEVPRTPPALTTPTPAVTQMKSGFLGGLSVKELASRVVQEVREDDCLGGPRSWPTISCLPSSPFYFF